MKRTVYVLLGVGLASLLLAEQNLFPSIKWPTERYSVAMIAINAIGAWITLIHPFGKVQRLIGLTLLLQSGVHAGRLLRGDQFDMVSFWWALSILALLQLALIGGWWLYELVHRPRPVRHQRPAVASAHPRASDP